ncbi:MAG: thymidine phosphorylase, partial [Euryarchaeota archaeon]|nr:thymidine phosphorylase [Euryarchaeota archaeon]
MSKTLVHRMCEAVRKGEKMSLEDLGKFIEGVAQRSISVTLIEEWLKCVHTHGISVEETTALTAGMMNSGAVLSWKGDANICDKHSTGGVGDKMSLILAPALAACGVRIPMLAGRGLGHTGGTIDKLESIPGFNCNLSPDAMSIAVKEIGCCIAAQNDSIAPADGLLYAIRDVTDTVDSIPLITASIVSKKAAEGLNALVLDVKCGQAAFMKTEHDAVQLAESMVRTANGLGIKTIAQVTDMNEPIGTHIGNALEVTGSILVLQGQGSKDTRELVMLQGGQLLNLTGKAATLEDGMRMIGQVLDGGQALGVFVKMCIQQGTNSSVAQQLAVDPQSV